MKKTVLLGFIVLMGFTTLGCEGEKVSLMKPAVSKLVEAAQQAKERGDAETAKCQLKSALLLEPDNAIAQYNMGILEVEANHFESAILAFENALKASPNSLDNQFALSSTYYNYAQDRFEKEQKVDEQTRSLYQKALEQASAFMEKAPSDDPSRADAQTIVEDSKEKLSL